MNPGSATGCRGFTDAGIDAPGAGTIRVRVNGFPWLAPFTPDRYKYLVLQIVTHLALLYLLTMKH